MNKDIFLWSDNWWLENGMAWFIPGDGHCNAIFKLNMRTNQCNFVAELPHGLLNGFRLNPRCMKYGNDIFCMPDTGDDIWVYQLDVARFTKIEIVNSQKKRLGINNFWQHQNNILAVSVGLKQIIEINVQEKKIQNYYELTNDENEQISGSIRIGKFIYIVSSVSNRVYQFDINSKKCKLYNLPGILGGLQTISFDGKNFWLSGYYKEVYVWNPKSNTINTLNGFPANFGIYNYSGARQSFLNFENVEYDTPTFIRSVVMGQYVWFIPFQTNKIIYVNKDTYKISAFEIEGEDETENSLLGNELLHKYLLEYVLDNRYIGLFSLKNRCILEIDTVEKKVNRKPYRFNNECIKKIVGLRDKYEVNLSESRSIDRIIFEAKLLDYI